jgi:hypothetical protein
MVNDDYFDDRYHDEYEYSQHKRDTKIDEAKEYVKNFFKENKKRVFYMKQLEVRFEKKFFHWITARALGELIAEGFLRMVEMPLSVEGTRVKFLFDPQNRYYKRPIKKSIDVIREYSEHVIARGCGEQADLLFFNALISRGFISHGQDTNEFRGKKWEISNHNLDFIIERGSVQYGCEVKNTFDYIDREEFLIKLRICEYLEVKPLFIMRYSPKSYNNEVIKKGGYVMIFEKQIYPFGQEKLVKKIIEVLGMPVDCPRKVPDGIIDRFVRWRGTG